MIFMTLLAPVVALALVLCMSVLEAGTNTRTATALTPRHADFGRPRSQSDDVLLSGLGGG